MCEAAGNWYLRLPPPPLPPGVSVFCGCPLLRQQSTLVGPDRRHRRGQDRQRRRHRGNRKRQRRRERRTLPCRSAVGATDCGLTMRSALRPKRPSMTRPWGDNTVPGRTHAAWTQEKGQGGSMDMSTRIADRSFPVSGAALNPRPVPPPLSVPAGLFSSVLRCEMENIKKGRVLRDTLYGRSENKRKEHRTDRRTTTAGFCPIRSD